MPGKCLGFIRFSLVALLVSSPLLAREAKQDHVKVLVGKRMLFAQPNATAPPVWAGLDAELLAEYESYSLVSVKNVAIERIQDRAAAAGLELSVNDHYDKVFINGLPLDARTGRQSLPRETWDPPYRNGESGLWIVQFFGPVKNEWRSQLTISGAAVVQYLKYNAYIIAADLSSIGRIAALPHVQLIEQVHRFMKPAVRSRRTKPVLLWIQLGASPQTSEAIALLESLSVGGIRTAPWSQTEIRVEGLFHTDDIDRILIEPLVMTATERPTIGMSDERAALSLTDYAPGTNPGKYKTWLAQACPTCGNLAAEGYYIGIADSGLDGGTASGAVAPTAGDPAPSFGIRPDFAASGKIAWGRSFADTTTPFSSGTFSDSTNSLHDVYGHGTLVAGVAAGNPSSGTDNGFFLGMGVAPSVGLFITKIDTNMIAGTLTPVTDATTNARVNASPPAYIQNHSYNQYTPENPPNTSWCDYYYDGIYSALSRDFDAAVRDARPNTTALEPIMLTVSSGNVDQQGTPNNEVCRDRFHALPPATAKNVLSVGMAENVRPDWAAWNCRGSLSQSYNHIASNTKTGTTMPGWFKPDLMAAASDIASSKSSDISGTQTPAVWCQNSDGLGNYGTPPAIASDYLPSSGTSFAAPLAAGAAVLASRRFAQQTAGSAASASPALLKAMLIAGATSMKTANPSPLNGGLDRSRVTTWRPNSGYAEGTKVIPRNNPNGFVYEASVSGNSGASEPVWPTSIGGTAPFGGGVWRNIGPETTIGGFPNDRQGFGRLSLTDVLSDYPSRYYLNETESRPVGGEWSKSFRAHDSALPVRVALVWTDIPAQVQVSARGQLYLPVGTAALMNDLNLSVEFGTPCQRYIGNVLSSSEVSLSHAPCNATAAFDSLNNVEVARFYPSPEMLFTVRVKYEEGDGAQNFALVAINAYDSTLAPPPQVPTNLIAGAESTTQVQLTWASVGATYEVQRSTGVGNPFETIGTPTANSFMDTGRVASTTYLYRVRAVNSTGVSAFSNIDLATTVVFADDPLVPGTFIEDSHLTQLRTAVSALRNAAALQPPSYQWTDPSIVPGVTSVQAAHVTEMRSEISAARSALGLPIAGYTDNLLAGNTSIRAVHFQELRDRVK